MALIIKSGTIITAGDTFTADIRIEGEKIEAVEQSTPVQTGDEVVDAAGKYILPGGVDVHAHLDLPMAGTISSDDHYTGHKAAAFGGTTTVIDFISQDHPSLLANVDAWRRKVEENAAVDYGFHMNITHLEPRVLADIPLLVKEGITSLKVFTAYNGRLRLQDGDIFRVLRTAAEHGMLTMVHAENGDVIDLLVNEAVAAGRTAPVEHALTRPAWGAVEAVLRAEALAAMADAPLYIVHMNAGGEVDQLAYARERGLKVMAETCPQYLFFTEDDLRRPDGAKWICSPPLRKTTDQDRLWDGIQKESIQVISTDHCPFFYNGSQPIVYEGKRIAIPGKELGLNDFTKIPNGLPGIGDRLPVMWTKGVGTGKISPNQFVALTSTNPAKIFGLYPQKGALLPGSDADLAIWDPELRVDYGVRVARHRTDYNLFEGWELKGFPVKVYLRGRLMVDGSDWHGKAGQGRFLARKPFASIL